MDWDAIGAIGEVTAAVAVVVSVLYLATQIRQNTKGQDVAAIQMTIAQGNLFNSDLLNSPELREVWVLGLDDPDACDDAQRAALWFLIRNLANNLYFAWSLKDIDAVRKQLWGAALESQSRVFRTKGGRRWMEQFGEEYGEEFFAMIQTAIADKELSVTQDLIGWAEGTH